MEGRGRLEGGPAALILGDNIFHGDGIGAKGRAAAIAAEKYLKALEDTGGDAEAAAHEPQVVVGTGGYAV